MDAAKDETGALEVRREDDGELCGYVTATADGRWEAVEPVLKDPQEIYR